MYSANAPVRFTPMPFVSAQRCRRPARQFRQRPHTTCPSALTMSPLRKSFTFDPMSTTSPTNSCPTTIGTGIVFCAHASHLKMCRSVPQMPVLKTRMSTSLIPMVGSGTSCSQRPGSDFALTSAFMGRNYAPPFVPQASCGQAPFVTAPGSGCSVPPASPRSWPSPLPPRHRG